MRRFSRPTLLPYLAQLQARNMKAGRSTFDPLCKDLGVVAERYTGTDAPSLLRCRSISFDRDWHRREGIRRVAQVLLSWRIACPVNDTAVPSSTGGAARFAVGRVRLLSAAHPSPWSL